MFNLIKRLFMKDDVTIEIGDVFIHNSRAGWELDREIDDDSRIVITNVNESKRIFEYTKFGCSKVSFLTINDIHDDYTKEI